MSIPVICPGCKASFRVSDKYAGKTGPCPKCKTSIKIPEIQAEVKVHEAQTEPGAKDSKGRALSKPLVRIETELGTLPLAIDVGASLVVVVATWLLGGSDTLKNNIPLLMGGLVLISPPLAVIGYRLLRDPDSLRPYDGWELWIRGGICAAAYVALWVGFWFVPDEAIANAYSWLYVAPPFLVLGGLAALGCFDLAYGAGVMHYCFYLAVTIFLRYLAGLPALWHAMS